jgi:two-component system sensor histidine kinase KdpD
MASDVVASILSPEANPAAADGGAAPRTSPALGYGLSVLLVAAAGVVAFVVDHIVATPNLSLIFVLPVIVAALSFGWGPALISAMLSVAVDDFFFIEPRFTFRVASPSDVWALALLLLVAAIASTVGAQSRGRALAARRAALQAEALHGLAHAVIEAQPASALLKIAATALSRIFDAPAVVLAQKSDKLWPAAASGGATLSAADQEAAHWALANDKPTRGETYPFDQAEFDFWPVQTPANHRLVLGVKLEGVSGGRPRDPGRQVDLVAAYLSAAMASAPDAKRAARP